MTDMDEAKMIEQAKAGDPKAQFELSQWARQMSILEPNEERWNRVAAKALVDAANGGYEPAKIMVQELISGKKAPEAPAEPEIVDPLQEPEAFDDGSDEDLRDDYDDMDDFEGVFAGEPAQMARMAAFYDQAQEEDYTDELDELDDMIDYENARMGRGIGFAEVMQKLGGGLKKAGAVIGAAAGGILAAVKSKNARTVEPDEPDYAEEDYDDYEDEPLERTSRSRRSAGKIGLSAFIEENWPVVKIVCLAVCAVLIVILLLPGKQAEEVVVTPMPTSAPVTPAPTPEPFPNEATLLEIRSTATLQYRPADSEYLTASKTMTVICEGAENLRQGPGAGDYPDVVMQLAQGTSVTVYAKHDTSDTDENGKPISWYLLNSNGTWGWMYGPSLG